MSLVKILFPIVYSLAFLPIVCLLFFCFIFYLQVNSNKNWNNLSDNYPHELHLLNILD